MKAKIFLNVTTKSMMDVTASLHYYEERKNNSQKVIEDIYKGNIIFSVTEKGDDGKAKIVNGKRQYLNSFMKKDTAKIVFRSILEDRFLERFGSYGIKDYGGSDNKEGQLRSRVMKISPYLDSDTKKITHYIFRIEEGKGVRGKNGKGTVIDGDSDIWVESWIPYIQSLKLATEILDYIRDEEIKAMLNEKPLYTIMYGKEGKVPPSLPHNKEMSDSEQLPLIHEKEEVQQIESADLYDETKISQLNDKELRSLLAKTESNSFEKEIYKIAVKEAKKRLGKAL